MNSKEDIELLEKLVGQLKGLYDEISQLAKKSPNDGLNAFKLKLVNKVLCQANAILMQGYRPFDDFESFESDDLPSNSDVTMMLAQYMEQAERYRSDHVAYEHGRYYYLIKGELSDIESKAPTKIGVDRK